MAKRQNSGNGPPKSPTTKKRRRTKKRNSKNRTEQEEDVRQTQAELDATAEKPADEIALPPEAVAGDVIAASGITPALQNIVATVNVGCRLDLPVIALHARNAEYKPNRLAAVILRIRSPKSTCLVWPSGKLVITGAKTEAESRLAGRKFARIIQKLGFKAVFRDFKIQNMVGNCDVGFLIRLERLNLAHPNYARYEPELFPGMVYRMMQPRMTLLIFVTGKMIITGAKSREEIYDAFEKIWPVLCEFRFRERGEEGADP